MAIIDAVKPAPTKPQLIQQDGNDGTGGGDSMASIQGAAPKRPATPGSGMPTLDTSPTPPPATPPVTPGTSTNIATPNPAAPAAPSGIVGAAQAGPAVTNPGDIKPVMGTVSSDSLIEDRLTRLLGSDSPLIARARQKAAENATARGLQNSTMAVQAGEAAAIDAAMPIATGDANTYARQDLTNQDVTNQFLGQDKSFAGQRLLAGEDRAFQGSENQKTRDTQTNIASMNANTQAGIAANELSAKLQMAGMDAQTRLQISQMGIDAATQQQLAGLNQNSMVNFSNGFATIQGSSMEQDAKLNALKNYMAIWAGSPYLPVGINLSALPSTTTTTTTTTGNSKDTTTP